MGERLQVALLTAAILVAIAGLIKIFEIVAWFIQAIFTKGGVL